MTSLDLRGLFRRIPSLSVEWSDTSVIPSPISISLRKVKHIEKYPEPSSTLGWTSIQSFWKPVSLPFTSKRACSHPSWWCSFQRHRGRIWRKYVRRPYGLDNHNPNPPLRAIHERHDQVIRFTSSRRTGKGRTWEREISSPTPSSRSWSITFRRRSWPGFSKLPNWVPWAIVSISRSRAILRHELSKEKCR